MMPEHFGDLLTLKDFLRFPECRPPLEFFGGRAVQKCSGGLVRGILLGEVMMRCDEFARSRELGGFYLGLRCTFGRVSLVPDLCYFARGRLPKLV